MKHNVLEIAVKALEEYYIEYSKGKSMEYIYGYMDALAVLRQLEESAIAPARYVVQSAE